jgi:5-(carboxyamino)imidazole ribonucleotide mutase
MPDITLTVRWSTWRGIRIRTDLRDRSRPEAAACYCNFSTQYGNSYICNICGQPGRASRRIQEPEGHGRIHGGAGAIMAALVGVMMGSRSDWDVMRAASETLKKFGIEHESRVLSAHRSPKLTADYASSAEERGLEVIIAAAGGAAHLAGVVAAHTILPVLGVPMESASLKGLDSLLSTVQMPGGIPVGTLAIGKPGATNAALLAVAILGGKRPELREKLRAFRAEQAEKIAREVLE